MSLAAARWFGTVSVGTWRHPKIRPVWQPSGFCLVFLYSVIPIMQFDWFLLCIRRPPDAGRHTFREGFFRDWRALRRHSQMPLSSVRLSQASAVRVDVPGLLDHVDWWVCEFSYYRSCTLHQLTNLSHLLTTQLYRGLWYCCWLPF